MQIVCPQCATSYLVADAAVGDGRMVRCTGCGHVWLATAADTATTAVMPAEIEMASAGETTAATASDGAGIALGITAAATTGESTDFLSTGAQKAPEDGPAVPDAPSLVPDDDALSGAGTARAGAIINADPCDDDEFARQRAARRRQREAQRQRGLRPSWSTVVLTLLAIIAAILAFRAQVVRAMPQTASLFAKIGLPVNLRGLAFHQVTVERELTDGVPVLIVQGAVVNVTRQLIEAPRLRFALRDTIGTEVYHWTALPEVPVLGPGDVMPFRTRLASPPANGENIVIRFFNRSDR